MIEIPAQPYDYEIPELSQIALVIIDMQRDFLEAGGFGEALGNDVSQLQSIIPNVQSLLKTFRALQLSIFQTVEDTIPICLTALLPNKNAVTVTSKLAIAGQLDGF